MYVHEFNLHLRFNSDINLIGDCATQCRRVRSHAEVCLGHRFSLCFYHFLIGLRLWCLTPLSTIFQLYWWRIFPIGFWNSTDNVVCYVFHFIIQDYMSQGDVVAMIVWYNYLCNQCLSSLKLWVQTPFMTSCTPYNIMW
jgi:hypothetical protein